MQDKAPAQQTLRVWGVPRKVRLRDRLLDIFEHLVVLLIILLILSLVQTVTAAQPDENNVGHGTLFYRAANDGRYWAAPLLHTDVEMRVTGYINRAHLTQTFINDSDDWVEGVYVFPLPENAAVDHLRVHVGDRVIEGQIKERKQARQIYEHAKRAGRRASLLEQQRPNMFTTSVANIAPHTSVRVEIEYQQSLRYDQGMFHLRLPLAMTPRYIPGASLMSAADGDNLAFAQPTAQVPDADRITPPVVPNQKINPVSIHIELDAGFPVSDIKSPYYPIALTSHGEGRFTVNLAKGQAPADHDFELIWTPVTGELPQAALFRERLGHEMYFLGMVLPPTSTKQAQQTLAREVIYVIDTSGSMGGVSIRQARHALMLAIRHLHRSDSFNVIQFNSATDTLFTQPLAATLANKTRALNYVANLQAGGGTEMMAAMQAALTNNDDSPRLRQVIFLTDGAVGNEDALFEYIRHHLGNSRLFTIGIGSAPNSHFMTKAARFGRGTYTYISRITEVGDKMQSLFAKLDSPVMRDIRLQHDYGRFEMASGHLPDLYLGEPLIFTARSDQANGELILKGMRRQQAWQARLYLQQARAGEGIAKLWARERIASLLDSEHDGADPAVVRQQVTALALQHHLVSKYTSLVAVDVSSVRPLAAPLDTLAMPVNLPAGQEARKIFALQAQTGTAQYLYWLIGLLLLGMSIIVKLLSIKAEKSCRA